MKGLDSARARGRTGGRPRAMSAGQVKLARQLTHQQTADGHRRYTITQVAKMLGVSRPTLYRALEETAAGASSGINLGFRSRKPAAWPDSSKTVTVTCFPTRPGET